MNLTKIAGELVRISDELRVAEDFSYDEKIWRKIEKDILSRFGVNLDLAARTYSPDGRLSKWATLKVPSQSTWGFFDIIFTSLSGKYAFASNGDVAVVNIDLNWRHRSGSNGLNIRIEYDARTGKFNRISD